MSRADITVLLATRNRQKLLGRTLESYCRSEIPQHSCKIVVVDNGSEDSTPATLASFKKRLPLEVLRLPIAGKSRALNFGLNAIEGRLAIITDDDAIPNSTFLRAWSRYLDQKPEYELFGGSIYPLFEVLPPKWLLKRKTSFDLLFGARDLPEGPIAARSIFGPNMAVRSSVFEAGFRFNENIGPNESDPHYPMGSETEFSHRVERNGAKAWFAREPRVEHIILTNQVSKSHWATRFYRHGRGVALQSWLDGQGCPSFIANQVYRVYNRVRMLSPLPSQRFDGFVQNHWRRGFADEWARRIQLQKVDAMNKEIT